MSGYLIHYGVPGMKWGVRRYQPYTNKSGTKYGVVDTLRRNRLTKSNESLQRDIDSFKPHKNGIKTKSGKVVLTKQDVSNSVKGLKSVQSKNKAKIRKIDSKYTKQGIADRKAKLNKAVKVGVAIAGAALLAYGAYKVGSVSKGNYQNYMARGEKAIKWANVFRESAKNRSKLAVGSLMEANKWKNIDRERQLIELGYYDKEKEEARGLNSKADAYLNYADLYKEMANNTLYGRYVNRKRR